MHVGTMRPQDKGNNSHEGHGLSVSECPDSWVQIARLGAYPWWTLARGEADEAKFLNWNRTSAWAKQLILKWAQDQHLAEPILVKVLSYLDTERGQRRDLTFADAAEARVEFEGMMEESPESAPALADAQMWALTPAARDHLRRVKTDPLETPELATLLWLERETELDGMYWDDIDDPATLSAPKAVILPARLSRWTAQPYYDEPASTPRSRMNQPSHHHG